MLVHWLKETAILVADIFQALRGAGKAVITETVQLDHGGRSMHLKKNNERLGRG